MHFVYFSPGRWLRSILSVRYLYYTDMKKKGHAAGLAFVALITVGLIAAGVGTQSWTIAKLTRPINTTGTVVTCTVTRVMGLFSLTDSYSEDCTLSVEQTYDVYCEDLVIFNHGIQYAVIAFCALSMLCCLIIMAVAGFNICENPYQTYCTAFGLAVYNGVGECNLPFLKAVLKVKQLSLFAC